MELLRVGEGPHDGRGWYTGSAPDLGSVAPELRAPSRHFVLLLASDTRQVTGPDLVDVATAILRLGASYVCCWGPGARRLEDCFDEARDYLALDDPLDGADDVVMTTSHEDEPLEEAVWFAAWSTHPTPRYEAETRALVAVSVGEPAWDERITAYLAAGAPLRDEA